MLAVWPKCFWPKRWKRCTFGVRRTRFCCCDLTKCLSTRSQWLWIQNTAGRRAKRFSRRVSNNIKTILRLDFLSGTETPFCRGRDYGLHVRKKCRMKNRKTRHWKISLSSQNWLENKAHVLTKTGDGVGGGWGAWQEAILLFNPDYPIISCVGGTSEVIPLRTTSSLPPHSLSTSSMLKNIFLASLWPACTKSSTSPQLFNLSDMQKANKS